MKVLVETRTINSELWFVSYMGDVIAETNDRYLVKKNRLINQWIPKKSYLMRCEIVKEIKENDEEKTESN